MDVCEWSISIPHLSPSSLFPTMLRLTCPLPPSSPLSTFPTSLYKTRPLSLYCCSSFPFPKLAAGEINICRHFWEMGETGGSQWEREVEGREWCDGGQECIKRPLLIPSPPSLMPPTPPPSLLGSAAPPSTSYPVPAAPSGPSSLPPLSSSPALCPPPPHSLSR